MVLLAGIVLGVMLLSQVFSLVYAQQVHAKSGGDIERIHRDAAINCTVVLMMAALLMSPIPWYKQAPIKGVYNWVSQNLKPRDKKGHGWLDPQSYANKKEEKAAKWMYSTIHKTLVAALLSGVVGVMGGALTKAFEKQLKGSSSSQFQPPAGPRSPYSGRSY